MPLLLRKLETVNKALMYIIEADVEAITVVKQLDDQFYLDDTGENIPYREVSSRIDINCKKGNLVAILEKIGNVKPFIVVKDVGMKTLKDDILEVNFIISRLIAEKKS